jgi:hypothetical protein
VLYGEFGGCYFAHGALYDFLHDFLAAQHGLRLLVLVDEHGDLVQQVVVHQFVLCDEGQSLVDFTIQILVPIQCSKMFLS